MGGRARQRPERRRKRPGAGPREAGDGAAIRTLDHRVATKTREAPSLAAARTDLGDTALGARCQAREATRGWVSFM